MANFQFPPFDPDANLQEFAGVGRNRQFEDAIEDDEVNEVEVICRKLNPDATNDAERYVEIPLAKPARAFYFGDHNLYEQEAKRFEQGEKARILNTDQFRGNLAVFEELKRSCNRGFVIPFVGAGMSRSVGLPDWTAYLLDIGEEAGLSRDAIRDRLIIQGDYEGAMDEILQRVTVNKFERDFERSFQLPEQLTGSVALLPRLFDNCVITTNFDRVLERCYENESKAFMEKVTGRGAASAFFRAIPSGDRYLLKLHGNVDNAGERVLSQTEYDRAYGNARDINMSFPIPKLLKRLFSSYTFLFLGCSLSADRTIQTFIRVVADEGRENLPHHYALLPSPSNPDKKRIIDQRLADAHITPLWYPEGDYIFVEEILQLLLD
ncbi:MAG: hypothetical protein C5B58_07000 [Acidobacteria bacterium]|nr:MAG: hypothetical protein C5B58_07000 [Acidobacteriota bacterium]